MPPFYRHNYLLSLSLSTTSSTRTYGNEEGREDEAGGVANLLHHVEEASCISSSTPSLPQLVLGRILHDQYTSHYAAWRMITTSSELFTLHALISLERAQILTPESAKCRPDMPERSARTEV